MSHATDSDANAPLISHVHHDTSDACDAAPPGAPRLARLSRLSRFAGLAGRLALGLTVAASLYLAHAAGTQGPVDSATNGVGAFDPARLGGDLTVNNVTAGAFGQSAPTLATEQLHMFTSGNRVFTTNWVTAPASVKKFDGLGPLFNRNSCSACHLRDGRGEPPAHPDDAMTSMLVRLSIPGTDEHGGPKPHPAYGCQLQDRAILGVPAEGRCSVSYTEQTVTLDDGEVVTLRVPSYTFVELQYGPLGTDILYSPRVSPAVFGLGLIEAISEADILANADPDDADGDGISGRPNRVWNGEAGKATLGRFGWKANAPDLLAQAAGAALGDIGLTTRLNRAQNFGAGATAAAAAYADAEPEMDDKMLDRLVFYCRTLAVPARRDVNAPLPLRGQAVFRALDCNACHVEQFTTGEHPQVSILSNQTIAPYTDLLLHDMGDALADGRPDFEATGNEWRTPPLWGIGLQEKVSGHTTFLHDGRARNLTEAILWHGGEGRASRDAFAALPAADREALLAFLNSL